MVTQLLTIREFLAQFTGNELTIAIIFFNWLVLGGFGTLLANRFNRHRFLLSIKHLIWLSLAAAVFPTIQLLIIRVFRDSLFVYGSAIGFYQIYLYILFTTAPYCLLIGFMLPCSLFVIRNQHPGYPGTFVYIADNIGDTAGGAIFSFVLVFLVTPLQAVLVVNVFLLLAIWRLSVFSSIPKKIYASAIIFALLLLITAATMERSTLILKSGETLKTYAESRYGRILVTENQNQHTLFFDGTPLASSHNTQAAEEAAHYPLSQINAPRHILLISAISGIIEEVQKHHPDRIDYLEINPHITSAMFQFGLLRQYPHVNVIHNDARAQLRKSKTTYDGIIMCLPEPTTFQLNRFYTNEFFQLLKSRLTANGVFVCNLNGFDSYLSEADRQKVSTLYHTLSPCFRQIRMIPGGRTFFLCSDGNLDIDIPRQLEQKKISTRYLDGFFYGDVTRSKIDYLASLLKSDAPINRDLKPVLLQLTLNNWFFQYDQSPYLFYALVSLFLLIYIVSRSKKEFVLFATGFTNMGAEILTIFAFQIFFGYIYFQIGIIVTVFLAGLLPGAWFGQKLSGDNPQRTLRMLETGLILIIACFLASIILAGEQLPVIAYLLFGFIVSCLCGFQFSVILSWSDDSNQFVSGAFSADLVGAALGALIISTVLIPQFGIVSAGTTLIALKTVSLLTTWSKP